MSILLVSSSLSFVPLFEKASAVSGLDEPTCRSPTPGPRAGAERPSTPTHALCSFQLATSFVVRAVSVPQVDSSRDLSLAPPLDSAMSSSQGCLRLLGSSACPAFEGAYVNPSNLSSAFPWMAGISSVAAFDAAVFDYFADPNQCPSLVSSRSQRVGPEH